MPIRRINSTGRKKIIRSDVQIFLRPDGDGVLTFDATLSLADYELPPESQVSIEAYRQTTFMRFLHGTAAAPHPPPTQSRRLSEFATGDGLLFRVKVASTGTRPGLLLAEADQIAARDDEEQPDHRIPLLPPAPADLGQEVWRVEFSESQGPQLLVNTNLADWRAAVSSWGFRSLVFPAAMRQVLWHVVAVRMTYDSEDPGDWGCRWLQFAAALPGVASAPTVDTDDEFDPLEWAEWIDCAVGSFSRHSQMFHNYKMSLVAEASG